MTMFRFDCLGPETFLRGRWVGIRLYSGRKVSVPVEIPRWCETSNLSDLELLCLFVLVSITSVGRGTSVNGWPTWAQEVAADTGRWPNREELNIQIYERALGCSLNSLPSAIMFDKLIKSMTPMPVVTEEGLIEFKNFDTYAIEDLVTEQGELRRELWLKASPLRHS